ncbi:MAG: hypothetical protein ACQEVA_01875 [Myxococcota bacterium]
MSESHTDKLESERSEQLRRAMNDTPVPAEETTEFPKAQWLAKRPGRKLGEHTVSDDTRETRPPEADTVHASQPRTKSKQAKKGQGSGVISLPCPPSTKKTSQKTHDKSDFRTEQRRTSPRSTIVELAAQKLADYLPRGSYRVLTGNTIYDAVTASELARLICRGAIVGVDKIMLENGPWHATSEHPALARVRALFGADLRAVLD